MSREQLIERLADLDARLGDLEVALAERERSEETLERREADLRQAQIMARIGVFVWDDLSDRCSYCSEALADLLGLTVSQMMETRTSSERVLATIHPEDRGHYDAVTRAASKTATSYSVDFRMIDDRGTVLHRRELGEPVLDDAGRVVRTIGTIRDITDIKRAEEALIESQSRFQDVAAASADWFWEMDAELRFTYLSSNVEKALQLPPEWFYGKTRSDLRGKERDREAWEHHLQRLRDHKPFRDFTYLIAGENSGSRWVSTSGVPVFAKDGAFLGYRGCGRDVSAAVQAERALRESEERYRNLVQLSPDGIIINADGRIAFANPAAVAFLGAERAEDLIGRRMLDFIHEDCHAMVRQRVADVLEKRETQPWMEQVYLGANGRTFDVESSATPIRYHGKTAVLTVFRDIAERKKAEEALRQSESRYRELFDESPVPMLEEDWRPVKQMLDELARQGVKDFRSYFRENPDQLGRAYDAARRFGISRAAIDLYHASSEEELRAAMTQETADPDELTGYGDMISDFYNGAKSFEYEATEIACDGTNLVTVIRAVIPPKYRDSWARVLVTMEDVTERKNVEAQLYQAQRLKAIGQLTGGVAHDFNNLLAVIMGNAEVLATRLGKDDKPAQAVIQAASRGADLTQRLLAFSRKQPLHPHSVDLDGLVAGMSDMLHRTLGETIETRTSAQSGLWPALADPGQLESALLNLAINARDAMPGGGILTIETANVTLTEDEIGAAAEVRPGEFVALAVSDTGLGMPPEVLEHAFEPFFTTKPVGEGSGLGLSMVYGFAKQSDGHVTIHSEQGRGTTVNLYLPRTERQDQPAPWKAAAYEPTARGESVLVLEDDADVRRLAVAILQSLDYDVLQAHDGEAALEALERSGPVDLLLSDVVLSGGMSGPQVAALAKSRYPAMKILFMSGHAEGPIRQQTALNAEVELINKPFRRRDLAHKVRTALDGIDD